MSRLRFVKRALYSLKRQFGSPVDYIRVTGTGTLNLETGVRSGRQLNKTVIKRCIVLSSALKTRFVQDLAYISGNRNFTEGGFFDRIDKIFIVDAKDLPFMIDKTGDYIIHNNKRYNIVDVTETEDVSGYVIVTRHAVGEQPNRVIDGKLCDIITITEEQTDVV